MAAGMSPRVTRTRNSLHGSGGQRHTGITPTSAKRRTQGNSFLSTSSPLAGALDGRLVEVAGESARGASQSEGSCGGRVLLTRSCRRRSTF